MRAVGFSAPIEIHADHSKKAVITLKGLESTANAQASNPAAKNDKTAKKPASTRSGPVVTELPTEYRKQLLSKRSEIEAELTAIDGAPSVTAAVRMIREKHTASETVVGLTCALTLVKNLLNNPKDLKHYRVKTTNPVFCRELGRLHCSNVLMQAIGFAYDTHNAVAKIGSHGDDESEPAAYVFRTVSHQNTLKLGDTKASTGECFVVVSMYQDGHIFCIIRFEWIQVPNDE
jgi:hypothetical protein